MSALEMKDIEDVKKFILMRSIPSEFNTHTNAPLRTCVSVRECVCKCMAVYFRNH